jgi:4-alpha-glucanotransferase
MTNPLGAATPGIPQQPSPYYPSSRLFRNLLYLRIEEVPGARDALPELEQYAKHGRALNKDRIIDRDAIYELKRDALERIWSRTSHQTNFSDYEQEQGRNLDLFATFCVLAEQYGANWHAWPRSHQNPASPETGRFARDFADRVRFHKWIQWLIDRQLLRASQRRNIMQDLPIGVDPGGADAWMWQDVLAKNVSVGAPPDPFSATGQDWGLPPFVPHKLRAAGYEPYIQTLRSAMRHSAGLRIDHVMGLFRLFWIPAGQSPQKGAYVRYNADEMLAIMALESARAKAVVVGEDLGTVEPGVREQLAQRRILSYRVLWFEEKLPAQYPELSLASISTHDLPTIAGLWSGADIEEQKSAGTQPNEEGLEGNRRHLQKIAGVTESAPVSEIILKAHQALAEAPSAIILASLDDALAVEERPNLPGVPNDRRPNWSIALPKTLEEIETDPGVLKIANILQRSLMNRVERKRSQYEPFTPSI